MPKKKTSGTEPLEKIDVCTRKEDLKISAVIMLFPAFKKLDVNDTKILKGLAENHVQRLVNDDYI